MSAAQTTSCAPSSRVRPAVRAAPSIAAACAGTTGAALLLGCVLALVGCHEHTDVPRYPGAAIYDAPASWDPNDVADSLDAMIEAAPISRREQGNARREIGRTDFEAIYEDFAPMSACGDPDLHGGCFLEAPSPLDRHEVRLPILDRDTGEVEALCESFLVVEAAKVVAWSVGLGAAPVSEGWPEWRAATSACVEGPP